jgi:Flp pilus assembly protein TadG
MKTTNQSLLIRFLRDQRGQVIPWVYLMMFMFLGMGAFTLDVGHAFFCYRQLQAATDAAALAGAQQLKNTTAKAVAIQYSATAGALNTYPSLTNVSMVPGYPATVCLTTVTNMGIACTAPLNANAIVVEETAAVPTFFARIFGISQMNMTAVSTAAIAGARTHPFNVAIILDTTASMTTVDTNCNGGEERIVCAESGVQVLLQNLTPCNIALGCGTMTNGEGQTALDSVSIFTFPPVTVGTANDDYNCGTTNPTITPYTLPNVGASTYAPTGSSSGTYQITSFMSNYKSGDGTTTLSTTSDLAMAVGAGTTSKGAACSGMAAPGGDGTYYASVIYAAQAALTEQMAAELSANANANPQNIMIILTDGEANASSSKMASATTGGTKLATTNSFPAGGGATSSLTNYPSPYDQCQQAVAAANYAKSQNTTVYAVGYGSESSGCTTDTSGPQANITPCQVMSEMASSPSTFYSDYAQSGSSSTCVSTGTSVVGMTDIFTNIADDFLQARLIPNGST